MSPDPDHHRLAPTPEHYAFVHEYLNGADGEFRERIDGAVDGGCARSRIKEAVDASEQVVSGHMIVEPEFVERRALRYCRPIMSLLPAASQE